MQLKAEQIIHQISTHQQNIKFNYLFFIYIHIFSLSQKPKANKYIYFVYSEIRYNT